MLHSMEDGREDIPVAIKYAATLKEMEKGMCDGSVDCRAGTFVEEEWT
jgi:hypothetical protein